MDTENRRKQIFLMLKNAVSPISGAEIANRFSVSRQVIVQDIAILRAENKDIISTYRGYMLYRRNKAFRRTFEVKHGRGDMFEELATIVDCGGEVLDAVIEHEVYGSVSVELHINSRSDIEEFIEKMDRYGAQPLTALTDGHHFHTVECDDEKKLDSIEQKLAQKGYLVR